MASISIFLTNLGKYNEGELVGEWVELPVDDDFEQAFKDIGIGTTDEFGQPYEEWFITDYESDFGLDISEYQNIYELNELAQQLDDLDEVDAGKVKAYLSYYSSDDIEDALNAIDDCYVYYDCDDMTDVAMQYVEEIGGVDQVGKDNLERYFDYDAFGGSIRYDLDEMAYDDWSYEHDDEDDEEFESPYDGMSDYELAEEYIWNMLGDISELGDDTLEEYFDYQSFGRDMGFEGTFVFYGDDCYQFV